jgi:hypothetical protein
VEAAVARSHRWPAAAAALLAVGFIAGMLWSGREPESRWRVKSEAAGVLAVAPERISRVEVTADGRRLTFVRGAGGWSAGGRPVPPPLAAHLESSLKFMRVSAPVRVLEREEYRGTALAEYGLDPPRYTVSLFEGDRLVLEAGFGVPNPQKVLQYMRLRGRDEVDLMSRFVGQEWERIVDAAAR